MLHPQLQLILQARRRSFPRDVGSPVEVVSLGKKELELLI